jgi:hypothetical protein
MDNNVNIYNKGLDYAMEFGSNWLQPIQSRLSEKYINLSNDELNHFDKVCRKAMNDGHKFIYNRLAKLYEKQKKISQSHLEEEFKDFITNRYNWMSNKNISRLFSQSLYYTMKEGLNSAIK